MATWKITASDSEQSKFEYTQFLKCRKFFVVDDSGSTAGAVLRQERAYVDATRVNHSNAADEIALWGSNCDDPTTQFNSVRWRSSHMGTRPSDILGNPAALSAIKKSDAWFLLTDGEIWDGEVHQLADLAYEAGILNVPLVFVITGTRGGSPAMANISVGISLFASSRDTMILFKETQTGKIYVIIGKGCFADLGGSTAARGLTSWNDLPVFEDEDGFFLDCKKNDIMLVKSETRARSTGTISLGSTWEQQHNGPVRVDLDALLNSGPLSNTDVCNVLAEDAFDALAIACKTRRRISELRAFVKAQKIEQVAPKLEDRHNAADIIAEMAGTTVKDEERRHLQEQLREAHTRNRQDYQSMIADFAGSAAEQDIRKRNQLVDEAVRSLATIEAASYNAEIIGRSNRARRAAEIDSASLIEVTKLDLEASSYRGYCLICCGEQEIMSICLKEAAPEEKDDNTSDFALNFPLAAGASTKNVNLVSSQNVCFQCALLGDGGLSIYKERLIAIIPVVQYDGSNKKYINDQLYSALTARLATGAAGIAQLFMSILQNVMQSEVWAGAVLGASQASADEQHEATQRCEMFRWMLNQILQNTYTRETFNEAGHWVKFPQALSWVAKDFEDNKQASFAVTYPIAGFHSLIALGVQTGAMSQDIVNQLRSAKLLYSVAAKYLADLQVALQHVSTNNDPSHWKQKYLELIYRDFNGPLIPVDQKQASLLTDIEIFEQRMSVCMEQASTGAIPRSGLDDAAIRKIQVIVFWLLFTQRGHCTAQTFFTRLTHDEPLSAAILDPKLTLPETSHQYILLSIFAQHDANPINTSLALSHNTLIPFANPFGASVLRCGVAGCGQSFCAIVDLDPQTITSSDVEAIRQARAKHLIDVFGIRGRFERSDTGLPERAAAGQPPTSMHTNLHMSIVREWVEQAEDVRMAIVRGGEARVDFVRGVRRRLCREGRGNIFTAVLDRDTEALLPSFFDALAAALRGQGKSGEDVESYTHDFEETRLHDKIVYELTLRAMEGTLL